MVADNPRSADPATAAGAATTGQGSRLLLLSAGAMLLGEYLLVSHLFDARSVGVRGGAWTWIGKVGALGPPLVTTAAAWFAFFRLTPTRATARTALPGDPATVARLPWVVAHLCSATLLLWVTGVVFGERHAPPGPAVLWLLAWASLALATGATSLLAILGGARWLRVITRDLRSALPAGLLAWASGLWTADLWRAWDGWTLEPVAYLLSGSAELRDSLLSLSGWTMRVAPGCGGYEGFGIVIALGASYAIRFRRVIPGAIGLLALPIGLLAVWAINLARFAALGVLGNVAGPSLAVASFHSKASWVLFSALALLLLLGVRHAAERQAPATEPKRLR